MTLGYDSRAQFNLRDASVLLIEPSAMAMEILAQTMLGLGARNLVKCESVEAATDRIKDTQFDLILLDSMPGEPDGYEFISWLRRNGVGDNRFAPVVVVTSHTSLRRAEGARDCGAHFVVAKPITPQVILERILWIVKESRPFITSALYCGPERRFKFAGPPPNTAGRRETDLSAQLGNATEPNMSQDQIDSLLQPMRAAV